MTTITVSHTNMGSGVAGVAPVNGLRGCSRRPASWPSPPTRSGASTARTTAWLAGAGLYASNTADSGALLSGAPWYPAWTSAWASGADLNLANVNIVSGAPNTIDQFQFSLV